MDPILQHSIPDLLITTLFSSYGPTFKQLPSGANTLPTYAWNRTRSQACMPIVTRTAYQKYLRGKLWCLRTHFTCKKAPESALGENFQGIVVEGRRGRTARNGGKLEKNGEKKAWSGNEWGSEAERKGKGITYAYTIQRDRRSCKKSLHDKSKLRVYCTMYD